MPKFLIKGGGSSCFPPHWPGFNYRLNSHSNPSSTGESSAAKRDLLGENLPGCSTSALHLSTRYSTTSLWPFLQLRTRGVAPLVRAETSCATSSRGRWSRKTWKERTGQGQCLNVMSSNPGKGREFQDLKRLTMKSSCFDWSVLSSDLWCTHIFNVRHICWQSLNSKSIVLPVSSWKLTKRFWIASSAALNPVIFLS